MHISLVWIGWLVCHVAAKVGTDKPLTSEATSSLLVISLLVMDISSRICSKNRVTMSLTELNSPARMRCAALVTQVVDIYLTLKRSHWKSMQVSIRKEALYKSTSSDNLNSRWKMAVESVERVVEYLRYCMIDENAGENRRRANRLCIIDRAEVAAQANIEAARLQGRTEFSRFNMLAFVHETSCKFRINAMIANRVGDRQLHDLWVEAIQLIEGEELPARGCETQAHTCRFSSLHSATKGVSTEVRERVDGAPGSGKPFQNADRCYKLLWVYGIISQLQDRARSRRAIQFLTGAPTPQEQDMYQKSILAGEHRRNCERRIHLAALGYCNAGRLLAAAEEETALFFVIRPLILRAGQVAYLAAEKCADESPYLILTVSSQHLESIVTALKAWCTASVEAIDSMSYNDREQTEKVDTIKAALDGAVRDVVESDLYKHPENDHNEWVNSFVENLAVWTDDARKSTVVTGTEQGRGAYYLERMKAVDPAQSPAHQQMRDCWEKAATAVLGSAGELSGPDWQVASYCARKLAVPSKLSLWTASNYAHLADGLYADAAAYFLRVSTAAMVGDAEQAKCWQTAAEALMPCGKSLLHSIVAKASELYPHDLDELCEPFSTRDQDRAVRWVRCAEALSSLGTTGSADSDGTTLRRVLISLTEQLDLIALREGFFWTFVDPGTESAANVQIALTASIGAIFEELASAATSIRRGRSALPSECVRTWEKHAQIARKLCATWIEISTFSNDSPSRGGTEDVVARNAGKKIVAKLAKLATLIRAVALRTERSVPSEAPLPSQ